MKKIKLNLKYFLMRGTLALVLLSTPASLTACGKNKEEVSEVEEQPTYIWADNHGIIEFDLDDNKTEDDEEIRCIYYIDNEHELRYIYVDEQNLDDCLCQDPNGKIVYETIANKKVQKFIKHNDLINIEENIDMLLESTKDNNPTLQHEYYIDPKTDETIPTGNIYICVHYYQTYKTVVDEKGKIHLEKGPVLLDFNDWNPEYPYVKEDYDKTHSYDVTRFKDEEIDALIESIIKGSSTTTTAISKLRYTP